MAMTVDLVASLRGVRERIEAACATAGRDPASVELVAVSKAHPEQAIRAAYDAGLRVFGENYAQELAAKATNLEDLPDIEWRFIGHLQRNKIKLVEQARATVDTVDSLRLGRALSARAERRHAHVEVLVQVNVAGESQKSGCDPDAVPALVDALRELPQIDVRGLMTVAPHFEDPNDARPVFEALRSLGERCALPELSMGMTHDLEPAIAEGATMVRLGTAIFGPRPAVVR